MDKNITMKTKSIIATGLVEDWQLTSKARESCRNELLVGHIGNEVIKEKAKFEKDIMEKIDYR